jgi:hypothetical protein
LAALFTAGFFLPSTAYAQVCSGGVCSVASSADLATAIAAINANTASTINLTSKHHAHQ